MSNQPLDDKLDRFRRLIVTDSQSQSKPTPRHPARYVRLAESLQAELVTTASGAFCLKRTLFPLDYPHGSVRLLDTVKESTLAVSAFTAHEVSGEAAIDSLVYLDTETTGLGGAGIVPFLIGVGRITESGFEVCQYLIPDYEDEAAMLEALLPRIRTARLVTYNGAAFDLPILRDRFIINRIERNLQFAGNIDLLQPTRRLFKRRLKDCSLGNVEKELFGFARVDDLPGYLVPSVYFEWLSTERTDQLAGVLEHNLLDIVSLHFLAAHIATSFRTEGEILKSTDDVYSLSRVYHRRNDQTRVRKLCNRLDEESSGALSDDIRLFQAFALKRDGDWESAAETFAALALLETREGYWANLELSKYCEHVCRDFVRSASHARRALSACPCSKAEKDQLQHRLARLQTKSRH